MAYYSSGKSEPVARYTVSCSNNEFLFIICLINTNVILHTATMWLVRFMYVTKHVCIYILT